MTDKFLTKFCNYYNVPLKSGIELVRRMEKVHFQKGEILVRPGEKNTDFFSNSRRLLERLLLSGWSRYYSLVRYRRRSRYVNLGLCCERKFSYICRSSKQQHFVQNKQNRLRGLFLSVNRECKHWKEIV